VTVYGARNSVVTGASIPENSKVTWHAQKNDGEHHGKFVRRDSALMIVGGECEKEDPQAKVGFDSFEVWCDN